MWRKIVKCKATLRITGDPSLMYVYSYSKMFIICFGKPIATIKQAALTIPRVSIPFKHMDDFCANVLSKNHRTRIPFSCNSKNILCTFSSLFYKNNSSTGGPLPILGLLTLCQQFMIVVVMKGSKNKRGKNLGLR